MKFRCSKCGYTGEGPAFPHPKPIDGSDCRYVAAINYLATQPPSPPAQVGTSGAPADPDSTRLDALDCPGWVVEIRCVPRQFGTGFESTVKNQYTVNAGPINGKPADTLREAIDLALDIDHARPVSTLATMSSPAAKVGTEDAMHIAHCNSGEYRGVCKYGSNNCSALLEAMAPAAPVAAVGEAVGTLRVSGWPTGLEYTFEPDDDMLMRLTAGSYRLSVIAAPQPRSSPLTEEKAAQPDPEKVMDLAFAMSRADVCCVLTAETKAYHENHRIRDAAREALRAYVTAKEVK